MVPKVPGAREQVQPLPQFGQKVNDALHAQLPHLFLWAAVAFGIGIAVFFQLKVEPGLLTWVGFTAFAVTTLVVSLTSNLTFARVFILATIVATGFLWAGARSHLVGGPVIAKRMYVAVQGRVVGIDRSHSQKQRLTLDQLVIDGLSQSRTPNRVRIALHGDAEGAEVTPGQIVLITAHLSPPPGPAEPQGFDFQRFAWFKQLGAVGYTRIPVMLWDDVSETTPSLMLLSFRKNIATWIQNNMSQATAGFAVAITTGDRSFLDEAIVDNLRKSNLAHLLAISGLHMGLLTALVFANLRLALVAANRFSLYWPVKKIAAVGAIIAGALYLLLSGASVATERAFIMVLCMFGAIIISRQAITVRAVALASFVVLALRPEALLSPGFQMSFAATLALVVVFSSLSHWHLWQSLPRWTKPLGTSIMSAAIAGAATAPFAAAHFNMVPHYGILANVVAVPIMGLVVMPGAILAVLLAPIGGAGLGLWIMDLGLRVIIWIAGGVADLPASVTYVTAPPPWVPGIIALGGCFLFFWVGRMRFAGVLVALIALGFWISTPRPDLLISDDAKLAGLLQNGDRVLNRAKGAGFAARVWLENDGSDRTQAQAFGPLPRSIIFSKSPDLTPEICAAEVRVVEAWVKDTTCPVFDLKYLKENGTLAGYSENGGYTWQTTRAVVGRRLWNDWEVRRRFGQ